MHLNVKPTNNLPKIYLNTCKMYLKLFKIDLGSEIDCKGRENQGKPGFEVSFESGFRRKTGGEVSFELSF